ncbi:SLBB domain-containing protein [Pedobacter africanus]|uniref:Protein involved in polysaccharide export, contains SLBB domain of the beta-grasp fold n=1 Tax=Pedobacter africanus TaxID=151894 RepID=A0A1W2BSP6_9SPHI|nr:SLBB domain-containing protein [Pedobacter africanus]SMC75764.1 protein involved in polysaccharide export, contains SLBB domain of the beta-grasp fold [Pedobacter africanus]
MNFKRTITAILFLFAVLVTQTAFSQSNYSDIKVDDLSDAQIRQMIQRAESIGYNDAQLEQMAKAQGMKQEEIEKLRSRVAKIRAGGADSKKSGEEINTDEVKERQVVGMDKKEASEKKDPVKVNILEDLRPKIFGSELFSNSNISFEPNLRMATPKNYVIGPDDELLVDLSGDNEANYKLKVSPEGIIRLQYAGPVSVGGLSVEQATAKIRSKLAGTYPGLRSGRTSVAVNLGNIRSIKITLVGEVVKPGSYTLSSLSTVFNALNASGGPNANGSFRKIQVVRGNKVVSTIDVYDFLLNGIQQNNIRLQDQDVINIPVYQSRVEITGEVKRPALFEVLNNESLQDVIRFAGGFTNQAYTANIKVLQNTNKERKISDVNAEQFTTYGPLNGDKYIVETILDRFENRVEIAGAVFRPGKFELEKGLTLKGLIAKADGLTEDAFLNRGYINRLNPDNTFALISFDVAKIMDGSQEDVALQREDKVTISSLFDLRDEYKITIQGEVRSGGTFDYADNMTLEDVIQMAGGFKENATPRRIEISRRIKNSDAKSESAKTAQVFTVGVDQNLKVMDKKFILKPFDVVSVRSSEGYQVQKQVKIEGEVLYPGLYTITQKNEKISDLVKRAGGLTPVAYAEGASLKRPGAEKVNPGDRNAINNQEEDKKKFLNLKRVQEAGVKDTVKAEIEQQLIQSDLVGIDLERILKKPQSRYDLIVEDGDVIRVPRQLQTVKVTGEVLNPNSIVYLPGKSFKQYVNGAGGFTSSALKRGAYIKYANGSVEAGSKFLFFNNFPKVKPGAEILVPKKAERERMTAQGWIGIGTAIASLGAIIVSLLR